MGSYAIVKDGSFYQKANSKEEAFVALDKATIICRELTRQGVGVRGGKRLA